jgi:hypothetical protein
MSSKTCPLLCGCLFSVDDVFDYTNCPTCNSWISDYDRMRIKPSPNEELVSCVILRYTLINKNMIKNATYDGRENALIQAYGFKHIEAVKLLLLNETYSKDLIQFCKYLN